MPEHVPIKKLVNLNTKEFSDSKCKRALHSDLDMIISRITQLMTKEEKCNLIKTKADKLIDYEKPTKKKAKKLVGNIRETRGEKLQKEANLTRREYFKRFA